MAAGQLGSAIVSVLALAVAVLCWGGVMTIRRGDRQKGVLMLVCALVLAVNVAILTV